MLIKNTLLAGLMLTTFAVCGQTETYDILTFTDPPGYARAQGKVGIQFGRNTANGGHCDITVYQSRPGTDDAKQEFIKEWTDLIKNSNASHPDIPAQINTSPLNDGWFGADGVAPVQATTGNYVVMLMSLMGHGRVTSILIEINKEEFQNDVKVFLENIKPETKIAEALRAAQSQAKSPTQVITTTSKTPATTTATNTPMPNNPLVGVWWGLGTSTVVGSITNAAGTGNAATYVNSSLKVSRVAFFDDGTFCQVLPDVGFGDYQAQRKKNPSYWGTYQLNNNGTGTIKLDGFTTSFNFTFQNNKLIYDQIEYDKIQRVDHYKIQGTFTAEKNPEKYQGPEPTLDFTNDGRFSDHGAIYWVRHVKGYTEDMQDKTTGNGTYDIVDYTIIFKYDDGRLIRMLFLEATPNPTQVRLGLTLVDRK